MHNYNRTVNEFGHEFGNEYENEFGQEMGHEMGHEAHEFGHELGHEYGHEMGNEFEDEFESHEMGHEYGHEMGHEMSNEMGEVFHEVQEMELATELLSVSNEAELEQFLGKLIRSAAKGITTFAKSPTGKALGGILKTAAKSALPILGTAAGTALGGPVGGMIGGKLAGIASSLFELELEGLSNEDKEFEVARAYVRFAGAAANKAARNPQWRSRPRQVANRAITQAARSYAPGLLKRGPLARPQSGYGQPAYRPQAYGQPVINNYGMPATNGADYGDQSQRGGLLSSGKWFIKGNRLYVRMDMVQTQENY